MLHHNALNNTFTCCTVALYTWSAFVKLEAIVDTLMGAVPKYFDTQNETVILKERW